MPCSDCIENNKNEFCENCVEYCEVKEVTEEEVCDTCSIKTRKQIVIDKLILLREKKEKLMKEHMELISNIYLDFNIAEKTIELEIAKQNRLYNQIK